MNISDLDDFDLREVSRSLQGRGVAEVVEGIAHDANSLIFARRSGASKVLEASDELGNL